MSKYKLKKWYPGIRENIPVGSIFEESETGYTYVLSKEHGLSYYRISKEEVNYPEFWEKVEEKDYEILSFKVLENGRCSRKGDILSLGKEDYREYVGVTSSGIYTLDYLLKNTRFIIYAVRRLSDNEIFTVGDKVEHGYCVHSTERRLKWEISSIAIKDKKLRLYSGTGFHREINELVKQEEPLFTTEDSVHIYEDDRYYKEKAQEWVDLNKPKYSKKDVMSIIDRSLSIYKSVVCESFESCKEYVIDLNKVKEQLNE